MVAGAMLLIGYLVLNYLAEDVGETISLNLGAGTAALAGLTVIYGLFGYRFLAKKSTLFAGLASFALFTATVLYLILSTGGFESQFLSLWIVVALLAGMFGWKTLALLWSATNIYYVLIVFEVIEIETDLQKIVLYLLATQLPFLMSYFVWHDPSTSGQKQKRSTSPSNFTKKDLSSDILINSIAEGVVVIDAQNVIQVMNDQAAEIIGWKTDEAIGLDYRSVFTLTDEKDQQILQADDPFTKVLSTGKSYVDNDSILHTRNNKRLEISMVTSPIKAKDGVVGAVVGVFRDVSHERTEERQRADFISTASHEMRTPVAAIEGYLALALNDQVSKIDSRAREYLDKAHASTQHLGKLFQDLLTAAKSEDGRLQINKQVLDINTLLEEVTESARFAADKKGLILEASFGMPGASHEELVVKPITYVHIDPDRVREVLTNLVDNAIKYTDEGKIGISMHVENNNAVIAISDTGPGIAQEDIPHLFQKFYRVDSTATRQVGGTGLGLFISRKIVELNDGRIWVESVVGKGSTFFVSLPVMDKAAAMAEMKKEQAQKSPLSDVTSSANL